MAEPGLPDSALSPENQFRTQEADSADQSVWVELEQLRSQVQGQRERIHHLEQALDQSLAFQEELRSQLIHQQFLESQLASTEEIANIQQQAITQLKQQLAQHRQQLANQKQDVQHSQNKGGTTRIPAFPSSHSREPLIQHQTLIQDRTLIQAQFPLQEAETIQDLAQKLIDRDASVHQLETELHRAHIVLQEQQAMIDAFQAYRVRRTTGDLADISLDAELFAAFCKIQELETQISKYTTAQAMLQHTCQELEQTRDRTQQRLTELEQQTAEMQEQILQQAQQSSEYETAIQHWKDRYQGARSYLNQVKQTLEQVLPDPPAPLAELISTLHAVSTDTSDLPKPPIVSRNPNVDLPDFLVRRHRYRARS